MESHRVNRIVSVRKKPTVTLYTYYINHHVGTPKQKQTFNRYHTVYIGLRVPDYGTTVVLYREIKLLLLFRRKSTGHRRCEGPSIYSTPTSIYIYESRCLKVLMSYI